MINVYNILKVLSNYISHKFDDTVPSPITFDEEYIALNLFNCLSSILESGSYLFDIETTLDHDDELDDPDVTSSAVPTPMSIDLDINLDADYKSTDDDNDDDDDHCLRDDFSLDYMKRAVDYFDETDAATGQRKRSWCSVKHMFRRIPNPQYITRFRKYIEAGGTKKQKIDDIDTYVYHQFENARHRLLAVHDIDLRRWGLQKARELNLNSFEASEKWLLSFKHRHRISSRKVTQLITKRHIESRQEIDEAATKFVAETSKFIEKYNPNEVLNTDQVGINFELYDNRTLTYMGEQSTWSSVRSVYNTTHSYTIQNTITMRGTVFGPLYLCLKEQTGHMSDKIKENLFHAQNVVVTCSKSGKLTSSLVTYWRDHCLIPNLSSKTLLLVDSFPSHANPDVYKHLKDFEFRVIPPKTTSIIQPLDVYYNRQYKMILRRIFDYVRLDDIHINLAERNNVIKLHSLVNSQMKSKAFEPMIKYAWYRSGYLKTDPGPFRNVKEICFTFEKDKCCEENCINDQIIRCSWCQHELCFVHFFVNYHYH
ncbi:unnamed protein product [Rotaria sp. Silwood2]|nr:unnamed protein product [Rotaria sp. Silwood2]CAF3107348.1 unnamed protein product [Rotaria sp. Silwood2]CAF4372508.1 unnamed protein product [Rotaria sp. Silwood2]CAF4613872.1 unnamed protein product [Rotaria sp. Silwood2]